MADGGPIGRDDSKGLGFGCFLRSPSRPSSLRDDCCCLESYCGGLQDRERSCNTGNRGKYQLWDGQKTDSS